MTGTGANRSVERGTTIGAFDVRPAVDEVLGADADGSPEAIIALADEPETAGRDHANSTEELPSFEGFVPQEVRRVPVDDRETDVPTGLPSMDELFG